MSDDTNRAVERTDLFSVPVWAASVPADTAWIRSLVDDIDAVLDSGTIDFEECSGQQTLPELQFRMEPHWQTFFAFVTETF
jgi:hypothetical protein